MALKPNAELCQIREQILEDPASGLTLQFERWDDGRTAIRLYGKFPFGNRMFIFNSDGTEGGAGTATDGACRPTWLREVKASPHCTAEAGHTVAGIPEEALSHERQD